LLGVSLRCSDRVHLLTVQERRPNVWGRRRALGLVSKSTSFTTAVLARRPVLAPNLSALRVFDRVALSCRGTGRTGARAAPFPEICCVDVGTFPRMNALRYVVGGAPGSVSCTGVGTEPPTVPLGGKGRMAKVCKRPSSSTV